MTAPDPRHLRQTFETAAERYDRARPGYPAAIFDELAELGDLSAGSRVLEIGAGTGLATVPLVQRGFRVVALELGDELASIARRRLNAHAGVEVIVAAFEDWPLPEQPFDAVVAATAFHWIDPEVRVPKAARALRPGGTLAIIETRRIPDADERVLAALRRCHQRWGSDKPPTFDAADAGKPPDSLAEIERSDLFEALTWTTHRWRQQYSTPEFLDLLMTFSNVLVLDPAAQAGLLACIGEIVDGELHGRIGERMVNQLLVARRRA
jgi:ubiquinone/menaquinone biosynthesis C-methylase UbiE